MKRIIAYNLFLIGVLFWITSLILKELIPNWLTSSQILISCALVGGLGGITYCLRGIYLNACVHKKWDDSWQAWYYIRPIVSTICGAISFIFLKAGLLILNATQGNDSNLFGFYAIAFIAGFNVDKFFNKIEDIAQSVWGIEPSRCRQSEEDNK